MPRPWPLLALTAAFAIRLACVFVWGTATPDSEVYAEIAKTWMRTGIYGLGSVSGAVPTLIRLPGYPAFLVAVFAVAGIDHYNAVRLVQAVVDVLTCVIIGDLARRVVSRRAGAAAFVLYAFCPFVANYVGVPLTEVLATFTTAVALWCAVVALDSDSPAAWIGCGLSTAYGILLRPDGGILLMVIGAYLLWHAIRTGAWLKVVRGGIVVGLLALAPLVPWTIRNARVFHLIQPLVPVAASAPDEFVSTGTDRWLRTWVVDYASVVDVSFHLDTDPISPDVLPDRALGQGAERKRVLELFATYNEELAITPPVDAGFAALAAERIHRSPIQYYLVMPALRALDMWVRPRTELLDVDTHWWDIEQGWYDVTVSVALGVVGLLYLALAVAGVAAARIRYLGLLAGFCVARTVIIVIIQIPEPRYVLECFPVVMVCAGAAFDAWRLRREAAAA